MTTKLYRLLRWLLRSYELYVRLHPLPDVPNSLQSQDSSPRTNSTNSPTHSSSGPSNEDIEAVIQMATSATNGRSPAPKDTRTQLFVGNVNTSFLVPLCLLNSVYSFRTVSCGKISKISFGKLEQSSVQMCLSAQTTDQEATAPCSLLQRKTLVVL